MKDLYIIGAGAFGRETTWVTERMNEAGEDWNICGFVDDDPTAWGTIEGGYPVLGGVEWLLNSEKKVHVICAIGKGTTRKKIMDQLIGRPNIEFATLIDPSVIQGARAKVGKGTILCAGTILAVDSIIGDQVIVDFDCTIGHDVVLSGYVTVNPGVHLSGCVTVGECTEIGTDACVIQGKSICSNVIIGAGAVVIRDITESGTYVGVPAVRK